MSSEQAHTSLESLHPALWRASQLGQAGADLIPTGHPALDAVLPGGGWPLGALIELCLRQPGIGEVRLLHPALSSLAPGPVALAQPPHPPNAAAWPTHLASTCLWLRPRQAADALWAAEQILRSGAFTALLLWQQNPSFQALRRLQLAAQSGRTLCVLYRSWSACTQSSPAPLRLALQAADNRLSIQVLKRRGHPHPYPVSLHLDPRPEADPYALDCPAPAPLHTRHFDAKLAH